MRFLKKGLAGATAVGLAGALVFFATAALGGPLDTDGDGIADNADNCILRPNPSQIDTDGDGCGNWCDADYDQTGVVDGTDFSIFVTAFNPPNVTVPPANPNTNCDGDGVIGGTDFSCFTAQFNASPPQPGPSAFPGACPGPSCCF